MIHASDIDSALRASWRIHPTPGFVAAAVLDGERIYEGAFGSRDQMTAPDITVDTVFFIASLTKAITATAAMQLVEAGQVGLDTPVGDVIPALRKVRVLDGFESDGTPRLRMPKRAMTLRHLLTHTSGFAYDHWNSAAARYMVHAGVPSFLTGLNASLNMPLMFDPGDQWEYGIGMDWVGKVVEAVSGQALDVYLAERVFTPLKMNDTAFRPTASMRDRMAGMNARAPDGGVAPFRLAPPEAPEFWSGGSGLYSTVRDYLTFLRMILHDGTWNGARMLKPETVELMCGNHIGSTPIRKLNTTAPYVSADLDLTGGAPAHWGLSWLINPEPGPNGRAAGSLGWAGIANTYYWADPQNKVAGVLMTQLLPFLDRNTLALFADFEHAVYAEAGGRQGVDRI